WPEYTPSPLADGSDNDGDGICNIGDTCTDIDDDSYCDETDDCDDNNATINPGASDSNCNGIDENCDGVADNEYVPILTSCGQGICAATGQAICTLGVETDTCAIGLPTTEICGNGIDEDCNGADLVCLLVDSDFDSSIDSDDLRLNATTQDWYESRHFWANGDQTLLTLDTNDIAGNTGKKARLKNNVGVATNAYLSQEFGYTPTSSFNLSFDIYIESIENSGTYNRTGNIYIGDNSATTNAPTGGNAERMAVLSFYDSTPDTTGTDIQLRALPTGGTFATTSSWTLIADNLSYDKWYKIKLVINPTGTYDIYINDAQAYTGMTRFTLTATAKYISFVADSDARGEFYIDNVYSPAQGYVPPACIDNDLDGYGNNCALGIDCNDANSAINPEATEICDNIDNDCDGSTDEELPKLSFYQDLDGDKYGNSAILLEVCQAPIGYTADSSDCNDTNAAIYPEATEICDNIDNDCDTEIDEEDVCGPTTETSCIDGIDNDGDTLTDCADSDCSADPACHVIVCGDGLIEGTETCDDGDTSSNDGCSDTCAIESGWTCSEEPSICTEECIPSAELCDGIDNDCNALTPDGSDEAWLGQSCDGTDSDLCAEGVYTCSGVQSCSDISPDNVEVCGDGLDQDCSGADLICLLVDSTFEASADDATLRANGAGQDWYESRGQAPTLLTLDTTNVGGNTGKKAKFDASNTTNAYVTQEFSTPQIGTFSIKWDIYIDNISDISSPDRAGWMLVGDDSTAGSGPNAANGERFVYMGFYKNGGGTSGTMDLIAVNRTGTFTAFQTIASGLNMKQWYNIRVDLNLTSDTYDVYVNDVFAATVTSRIAKTQVTHISFAQWNDGAGTFYIDNVYSPALT
ncbi:MAG: MopE-related protein, partial [Candidatus Woesearchaeota archaeon]